ALFFWQGAGEIGKNGSASDGTVTDAAALAGALTRHLNRVLAELVENASPIPPTLAVSLLIESFAPCRFKLDTLSVGYALVVGAWSDQPPETGAGTPWVKQVLRFPADRLESQSVMLVLPGAATIRAATLKSVESQARAPLALAGQETGESGPLSETALAQKQGLLLDGSRWGAQRFTPEAALTAGGVALALLPLAADSEVSVALQESWQGRPSGSDLAQATLELGHPGEAQWVQLAWREPLTLSTRPYWLLLRAARGRLLWLAGTGGAGEVWMQPERVGAPTRGAPTPAWSSLSGFAGQRLLYQFFSHRPTTLPAGAPTTSPAPATRLTLGSETPPS
ncbi:MAG: hypothetical protein ACRDIB_01945, partial [Ardenticatenaceae bacterium]